MNILSGFEGNTGVQAEKGPLWAKQSPRAWFGRFATIMKEFGYKQSQGDHPLFI